MGIADDAGLSDRIIERVVHVAVDPEGWLMLLDEVGEIADEEALIAPSSA